MYFHQDLIGNSHAGQAQWSAVTNRRRAVEISEALHHNAMRAELGADFVANQGIIPEDVYQEFDRVSVERMRLDDGDAYLNDLMPLSRSVNIGKLVSKFRRSSDAGNVQTSMTGQIGIKLDQVEYNYDGAIIPIHDTGFFRNWREWNAQQSEGFDALIDDQRLSVATVRRHAADQFVYGHKDKNGQIIVVDGVSWGGMRADSRVVQIDLGAGGLNFDFTDNNNTGEQIKVAFIQIRDAIRIGNKCGKDLTIYISNEIASNFERRFSQQFDAKLILQELAGLLGIATIKATSKLTGNELMGFPLDSESVRPIVGMGINTVAMPRPMYNSNYEFAVWGAIGFQVKTDYSGNSCAFYAVG